MSRRRGGRAELCPAADGGEGTVEALVASLGGATRRAAAHDPLGRPIEASLALLGDRTTAAVEVAAASGLGLIEPSERDPERASSGEPAS